MNVKQIGPQQASEILESDSNAAYIDVRTESEFQNGHPVKAVNIPVVFPHPSHGQMAPNPEFLRVVESRFSKETRIIVGCQMGRRSQYAAELLMAAGFKDVSNMQGGYGGARDPMSGVLQPGWVQLNLPVETLVTVLNSYSGMKKGT